MTTEEKAKAYEMALEAARKELGVDRKEYKVVEQVLKSIFPGLRESEDERVRKRIVLLVEQFALGLNKEPMLAYLEKQKNAFENGRQFGIMQEQARQELEWTDEKQKEQKPNIELIQRAWYMEGYHDRKFNREPKWNITTGEGGPRYEENPKYGKMLEEKDYSGLTDLERVIHRGFLSAGVGNVPVTIIKETAKECLAQTNPAWSEEDKKKLNHILEIVHIASGREASVDEKEELESFLKSLRPSWKPSKEEEEPEYYQHFDPDC